MSDEIVIYPDDRIKEGWLVKQSMHLKQWRKRWCVVTPHYLLSFRNPGECRNPTEWVRLHDCSKLKSADEETGKENSFRVLTPSRTLLFIATDFKDKNSWITHIGRQMTLSKTVLVDEDSD